MDPKDEEILRSMGLLGAPEGGAATPPAPPGGAGRGGAAAAPESASTGTAGPYSVRGLVDAAGAAAAGVGDAVTDFFVPDPEAFTETDAARHALQGATRGWSDEMRGLLLGRGGMDPEGRAFEVARGSAFGGAGPVAGLARDVYTELGDDPTTYSGERDRERAALARSAAAAPVAAAASDFGGGLGTLLLGASGGFMSAVGTGALDGLGRNERPEDLGWDVGIGAGIGAGGATLGAVTPVVGRFAAGVARRVPFVRSVMDAAGEAAPPAANAGLSRVRSWMQSLSRGGVPEAPPPPARGSVPRPAQGPMLDLGGLEAPPNPLGFADTEMAPAARVRVPPDPARRALAESAQPLGLLGDETADVAVPAGTARPPGLAPRRPAAPPPAEPGPPPFDPGTQPRATTYADATLPSLPREATKLLTTPVQYLAVLRAAIGRNPTAFPRELAEAAGTNDVLALARADFRLQSTDATYRAWTAAFRNPPPQ